MIQELDADTVIEYFMDKNILITGSTGFLGKVLVEKILRVQPDVKKLFLLVRALDDGFAKQRTQTEVTGKKIFGILKENMVTASKISSKKKYALYQGISYMTTWVWTMPN
ncbi:hypothetical protein QOZ80_8AG0622730 [Eleusine coracana subsp. coracana]|nr:hypothetical protein QOZ80_8AG0622730 [Eleusine coracana subsp. coracana]